MHNSEERLKALESRVWQDLERVNVPAKPWVIPRITPEHQLVLDVAIIGGGMAGMTLALALMREGVNHVKIFDENEKGREGPWPKYARMKTLRSGKHYLGPALDYPSLTFKSWYEAKYGNESLEQFEYAPTSIWWEYLQWFSKVLKLPIINHKKLVKIVPVKDYLELKFNEGKIFARKVILATGQGGCGGCDYPQYMRGISKSKYLHTGEVFDHSILKDKRVCVVGAGASAFDAAAVSLEEGAKEVNMLVRRPALPTVNSFAEFAFQGMLHGFYHLSDEMRYKFFNVYLCGAPPPKESILRVEHYRNFTTHFNCFIEGVNETKEGLIVKTNQGNFDTDLIIFGTGFNVDLRQRPELELIRNSIHLWQDRFPGKEIKYGGHPYLGPYFEFTEKYPGSAPYLKNIYCFNNGASMSHGLISNDIPGVSIGAARVAKGIAIDFFLKESETYFEYIKGDDYDFSETQTFSNASVTES